MSVLILVRHGQASLFTADYDRLSAVGERQAALLGEYWARQGVVIDEVYAGPRLRQQHSAELAGQAYRDAGLIWPEVSRADEFDEYDLDGLANRLALQLAEQDPEFGRVLRNTLECADETERVRHFQKMFEMLLLHWQSSSAFDFPIETWSQFQQRVSRVIRRLQQESGRGKRIAVFTSGGFIGCAVQQALGVSDRTMLELNWRIRNSSLTEFVFTPDRFTLDSFNAIPHLTDAAHWTYR